MKEKILDNIQLEETQTTRGKLFTVLAAINACMSIMFSMSLGLLIYEQLMGRTSSGKAFIFIYILVCVLCVTGMIFTVLSFAKKEWPITLKWIAGIINAIYFIIFIHLVITILIS